MSQFTQSFLLLEKQNNKSRIEFCNDQFKRLIKEIDDSKS